MLIGQRDAPIRLHACTQETPSVAGLGERIGEHGTAARHDHIRLARKPCNRRTRHQLERRIGGERVA